MRRKFPTSGSRFAVLSLLAAFAAGCSGSKNDMEKQLTAMSEELTRLQGDHDMLVDRVTGLEAQVVHERNRPVSQTIREDADPESEHDESGQVERPRLKVIRLGPGGAHPEGSEPVEAEEDDEPRPVLRGSGDRMRIDEGPRRHKKKSEAPKSRDRSKSDAAQAYESALSLVRGGQYGPAGVALSRFLERYPQHPYADNALYWRGECHYARGAYSQASSDFREVLSRYPHGNKVPDALLKLGYVHMKRGALQQARATFSELSHNFPKSEATRMIPRI